jgi:DNA polymerase III alpha subunit (gram-positive type)
MMGGSSLLQTDDPKVFEELYESVIDDLSPGNALEVLCANEIAEAFLNLAHVKRLRQVALDRKARQIKDSTERRESSSDKTIQDQPITVVDYLDVLEASPRLHRDLEEAIKAANKRCKDAILQWQRLKESQHRCSKQAKERELLQHRCEQAEIKKWECQARYYREQQDRQEELDRHSRYRATLQEQIDARLKKQAAQETANKASATADRTSVPSQEQNTPETARVSQEQKRAAGIGPEQQKQQQVHGDRAEHEDTHEPGANSVFRPPLKPLSNGKGNGHGI